MSGSFRTAGGGRIDREGSVAFTFDDRPLTGLAGDTLASALLANGVHLVGRSFKYHRPRGILSAGSEEPSALVTVVRDGGRSTPNLRATQVEIYDGLVAHSQNRWPTLGLDAGAVNDYLSPVLPAGFYYKTFMGPGAIRGPRVWHRFYEPLIRRAAGFGKAPAAPDPDRYLHRFAHCDVLIIGAGAAGIGAAIAASESKARVILADEQAELGGGLLSETALTIDGRPAGIWLSGALGELRSRPNVRLLPRTTALGAFTGNFITLAERVGDHSAAPDPRLPRERHWKVRAGVVVLATGAIERPLVFPDNDRPGVMLAGAARTYLNRYGVRPGKRAVIATSCDTAYAAALDLKQAGVEIAAIADLRPEVGAVSIAARDAGIVVHPGHTLRGTHGRLRVRAAEIGPVGISRGAPSERPECDVVLMCGGWTPTVHLFSQARGKLAWSAAHGAFVPGEIEERVTCAGALTGKSGIAACLADGVDKGHAAAAQAPGAPARSHAITVSGDEVLASPHSAATAPHLKRLSKAFVDFQNDVTAKDLAIATREGFRSIEHVKRYTTTGMGTDQGKTSNINALGIVGSALGTPAASVGHTTYRMPYTPVTFGTLAGTERAELLDPVRWTPTHDWARANGAVFEDVGTWKRARYFTRTGETMEAAVARECRAVRTGVGIFDASTLGKIEVVGPDAATFLDRLYTGRLSSLAVGRCRYALMLTEAGFVLDDGIVARLAPDRFHVTTTTGGAPRVLNHMEDYAQTEWPDLAVWCTSTTEQWAVIAVQGPRARDVIASLVAGIDLATPAMGHMSVREGRIAGVPMRLFRVSFTGELGYEINVPAGYGRAVWEAVLAAGAAHGAIPYGTEAMHVLRAEKGYVILGQDTDGTQVPADIGLARLAPTSKGDYVGKRSLARPDMQAPDRPTLIGLLSDDPTLILEEGAQIVEDPRAAPPMRTLGHVTSAYRSEALGRSIALALLKGGHARQGETLHVSLDGRSVAVKVTAPCFLDPTGDRLNA